MLFAALRAEKSSDMDKEKAASRIRRERRVRQFERLRQQIKVLTDGLDLIENMTSDAHVTIAEVTCKNVHQIVKSVKAAAIETENSI